MRYPGNGASGGEQGRGSGHGGPRGAAGPAGPPGTGRTGRHRPTGGSAGKGPLRGYPPAPGQPPPLYPPGPFSAWNRRTLSGGNGSGPGAAWQAPGAPRITAPGHPQAGYRGQEAAGYPGEADRGSGRRSAPGRRGAQDYREPGYPGDSEPGFPDPGYAEPGYSALAVSEPAADVISTQTWQAIGDGPDGGWNDRGVTVDSGPQTRVPGRPEFGDRAMSGRGSRDRALVSPEPGPVLTGPVPPGPAANGHPENDDDTMQVRAVPGRGPATASRIAGSTVTAPPRAPGRGPGTRGRARSRPRPGRARGVVAGALAVAVLGGGLAYLLLSRHGHSPSPSTSPQAATVSPKPTSDPGPPASLGPWGYIASRVTDPVPLSLGELFPARFANAGVNYDMAVDKARVHCNLAVSGTQLQSAVGTACTQAMSASYLSSQQVMGTIGVLNLATAASAATAGKATGPSEFVTQLPGPSGPTKNLTRGTGIEAAEVKGHYLILVWAELASLKAPTTAAQKQEVQAFISVLIQKTANVSLASREVTGRPAT